MTSTSSTSGHGESKVQTSRPLSPHLQVYRWRVHMFTSIMHRATGAKMAFAALVFVAWLVALASGEQAYDLFVSVINHPLGQLVAFGLTWAFFQHMASGFRHLIMDTGAWYDLGINSLTARLTYIVSTIATLVVWAYILQLQGVL